MTRLRKYYQLRADVLGRDEKGNILAFCTGELITDRVMKRYNVPDYMCKKVTVNPDDVFMNFGVRLLREKGRD